MTLDLADLRARAVDSRLARHGTDDHVVVLWVDAELLPLLDRLEAAEAEVRRLSDERSRFIELDPARHAGPVRYEGMGNEGRTWEVWLHEPGRLFMLTDPLSAAALMAAGVRENERRRGLPEEAD